MPIDPYFTSKHKHKPMTAKQVQKKKWNMIRRVQAWRATGRGFSKANTVWRM